MKLEKTHQNLGRASFVSLSDSHIINLEFISCFKSDEENSQQGKGQQDNSASAKLSFKTCKLIIEFYFLILPYPLLLNSFAKSSNFVPTTENMLFRRPLDLVGHGWSIFSIFALLNLTPSSRKRVKRKTDYSRNSVSKLS